MRKLLNYLFRRSRRDHLPHLQTALTEKYNPAEEEAEIQLVLMTGLVRDPAAARKLMARYGAKTAAELLEKLPPPRVDWRGRLRRWIQLLEGSYGSDPHQRELHRRTIGGETPRRSLIVTAGVSSLLEWTARANRTRQLSRFAPGAKPDAAPVTFGDPGRRKRTRRVSRFGRVRRR